ncbi:MAG: transglycosylase SLT domain-containing protein, partial [Alphaproteobacteria bacterium]|nr:transglycosylase SLT domain-containing protein [Alphaproteobacteria bacterium]
MLSIIMSMGAAAGHSALIQDFALGHNDQGAQLRVASAETEISKLEGKLSKTTRNIVRGMQAMTQPANDAKPIARILDSDDERTYRDLFAAMNDGKLKEAEALAGDIKDGTLLGTAQALFLLHPRNPNLKYSELADWLKTYGDLPQAAEVYKKALSMRVAGDEALPALATKPAATQNSQKSMMAETLEWKKPRRFTAESLWRAGKYDEVIEALRDADVAENAPAESYYPIWIKGLAAFATEDYAASAHSFMKIAKSDLPAVNRAAAAYWAGRAFEKTLQNEQANIYFAQAALDPNSYYGMLAIAHKAGNDSAVLDVWHEPSLSAQHVSLLRQDKAGARALALLQIGEKDLAVKELQSMSGKPALQDALAALSDAAELPMVVQPRNSKQASRYPMMPWRPAGGFISDPSLVMAIAWNESRFEPRAHNPSGARGIMQMMPDTAERITVGSSGSLFNAQANVTLG